MVPPAATPCQVTLPDGVTAAFASGPYRTLPVLPALEPLLPCSGLAPGAIIATAPGLLCAALIAARIGGGRMVRHRWHAALRGRHGSRDRGGTPTG